MTDLKTSYFKFWVSGAFTSKLEGSDLINLQISSNSGLQIGIHIWIKVDQLDDTCFIMYCSTCFGC